MTIFAARDLDGKLSTFAGEPALMSGRWKPPAAMPVTYRVPPLLAPGTGGEAWQIFDTGEAVAVPRLWVLRDDAGALMIYDRAPSTNSGRKLPPETAKAMPVPDLVRGQCLPLTVIDEPF